MLVLVVGDAHIPYRATAVPPQFQEILSPGKIKQVVSVGNTSDAGTRELLRKLTPDTQLKQVPGEFDTILSEAQQPLTHVFDAGSVRIGIVSGFMVVPADDTDALAAIARQLDVKILLWGGSHKQETHAWAGHYFINPGSLTGAPNPATWSNGDLEVQPSFCLLDVGHDSCTVYMYHLENEMLQVKKAQLPLIDA